MIEVKKSYSMLWLHGDGITKYENLKEVEKICVPLKSCLV